MSTLFTDIHTGEDLAELPTSSVVIDVYGSPWQKLNEAWATFGLEPMDGNEIIEDYGPFTVVYLGRQLVGLPNAA